MVLVQARGPEDRRYLLAKTVVALAKGNSALDSPAECHSLTIS